MNVNIEKIKLRLFELENEKRDLNDLLEEAISRESRRWRADKGAAYYYKNDCGAVTEEYDMGMLSDDYRYSVGNYYKSHEEAFSHNAGAAALTKIEDAIREGNKKGNRPEWTPDFSDGTQSKYYIWYDVYRETYGIGHTISHCSLIERSGLFSYSRDILEKVIRDMKPDLDAYFQK